MKFLPLAALAMALTSTLAFAKTESAAPVRTVVSLDADWRFQRGKIPEASNPGFDDRAWQRVDVPHDYVIEGPFVKEPPEGLKPEAYKNHGFLPLQPAVYRKAINIPAAIKGRRLWIEFDGVFSDSHYWLNGKKVGSQFSGYSSSRFDVTDAVKWGAENIITVSLDPKYDGWWYEGGGIYRHVRLVAVDPVHIAPDGVFVAPAVSDPDNGINADAQIAVSTELANESAVAVTVTVLSELLDARGKVVLSEQAAQPLPSGAKATAKQQFTLARATLWSLENPYLYQLRSTVSVAGKTVDQVTTNFGVRQLRFDAAHGFFLNGKHVLIQGVNNHQDHAGVGIAIPDRLIEWRLERLKEVGVNAVRLSHNPVAPMTLDYCDRMGILVMAENRHLGDTYANQTSKNTLAVEHRDLTALVRRDRNHPSIILWSLCNEQYIQGSPEGAAIARAMKQRVNELDPTRLVTAAMNGGWEKADGFSGVLDVIGFNYNPTNYEKFHTAFPDKPVLASEIASEVGTRGVYDQSRWANYHGVKDSGYVSAYSINAGPGGQTVENALPPVMEKNYMAGAFVWTGFDYKGEPRPFGWPCTTSHYGFMDICGFPKDSYYYYKSWWTKEPVLHLFPHWNWAGKEGQDIPVWVHSNCQEVELFLNGVSQGKKTVTPLRHLEWTVKYAPGKLVAKGLRDGKPVEALVETTGAPAGVRLTADRTSLTADNADLAVVNVAIIDAQGRVVPTADNKITFTLNGPAKLIGVGNGDPSSHEPDKASSRAAFNGLAQAIVQTTMKGGAITLKAEAAGLRAGNVTLTSK